jgi:hypothetical protein
MLETAQKFAHLYLGIAFLEFSASRDISRKCERKRQAASAGQEQEERPSAPVLRLSHSATFSRLRESARRVASNARHGLWQANTLRASALALITVAKHHYSVLAAAGR